MKLKEGFILREVAGNHVVVPVGAETVDFNGMITLNDTGAFLWKQLENGVDEKGLLKAMADEYDVQEERAAEGIRSFIENLKEADLFE